MLTDKVESGWIDGFCRVFELCKFQKNEEIVLLTESQSRALNVELAELALGQMGLPYYKLTVATPVPPAGPIIRSSGACQALSGQAGAVRALAAADVVVDLTVEGLMHAPETAQILQGGARVMNISNEHPEALCRLLPDPALKEQVKDAVKQCRSAKEMRVIGPGGTDLTVAMEKAASVGIWGWTDRPGTLAHWPGGLIVSFPQAGSVNGRLAYQPGDINLTFKRYFESEVVLRVQDDYVIAVEGQGTDAALMRDYFASFGEREAYATSHVGWGMNKAARYEALTMYDKRDTNGTELRALAGNFLYSTGANEFAGRFTRGHFDLPLLGADIALDGVHVVKAGVLV